VKRLIVVSFSLLFSLLSLQSFASEDHSDMHDVMAHLLTPASEKIWNASGFIITEEGEFSLAPTNQEEWNEVMFGAKVIIESTLILNRSDRSQGRSDWIRFSELLEPIGKRALEAAESKDPEKLFEVGADLYQACVACHNVYMKK
tara:strand:+ start:315 stop:749 length:435 start_codon:yes stop_codon:yes gene_type:complete